jgi:hypothetical protein
MRISRMQDAVFELGQSAEGLRICMDCWRNGTWYGTKASKRTPWSLSAGSEIPEAVRINDYWPPPDKTGAPLAATQNSGPP